MKYQLMRSAIMFFLYTLLDYFKFATANTSFSAAVTASTRSTPAPVKTPRFPDFRFWSGESLKAEWAKGDESKWNRSTRFNLVDSPPGGRTSAEEHKNYTNVKLNGYTLIKDLPDILAEIDENITISSIATTIEYNDIVLVRISKKPKKYFRALEGVNKYVEEEKVKKIIVIVHGLSAMGFRLIPCLYKVESFVKLVKIYTSHLDKFDIFLIPMANPDGIADETLGIWNKNKSPQSECSGVFLDRNFDVKWNTSSNLNSCSQKYPGTRPFSERESRAVADLIHHYNHKIVAYIHVHAGSYSKDVFKGDAILYPKGYTENGDYDKYVDMDAEIEEAMRNAGFKVYGVSVTSMQAWYGKIYGSSVDYATTIYGIPYGMEFVMQPYERDEMTEDSSQEVSDNVLTEVWKRVIDVIFKNIYKTTEKVVSESFSMGD